MSSRKKPKGTATGTETKGGDPQVSVRRFQLVVTRGPDAGKIYRSHDKPVVLGTHGSADLILQDRTVSRFHCEIAITDGTAVLRDLGSHNGTLVDGVAVLQAPLRDGALVTAGRTEVRFDLGEDSVPLETSTHDRFGKLIGQSALMRAVFHVLERAAASDATVLLEGETGTGKELAAEAIHSESARRDGPFVVVDCSSILPDLLESELFGHERGAFTGASDLRQGAFEAAHGGTLFLDEVGELGTELQPKLLRALEQREVRRIGSHRSIAVDLRIVAATNRNLRSEVNAGRFRPDLYYRLAVLTVKLPPLRERVSDIPLLIEKLLEELGASEREGAVRLRSAPFLAHLARHTWPGNIRELRNHLETCLLSAAPAPLLPQVGDLAISVSKPFKDARDEWVQTFERRYLEELLRQHRGNVREAARHAGLDRVYLYRMLWRHGLR